MIIVSQDKKTIINFDNVNEISVNALNQIVTFNNNYNIEYDCSTLLGEYKTEKRAKEVLEEIIYQKAIFELCKLGSIGEELQLKNLKNISEHNVIFDTYELPNE